MTMREKSRNDSVERTDNSNTKISNQIFQGPHRMTERLDTFFSTIWDWMPRLDTILYLRLVNRTIPNMTTRTLKKWMSATVNVIILGTSHKISPDFWVGNRSTSRSSEWLLTAAVNQGHRVAANNFTPDYNNYIPVSRLIWAQHSCFSPIWSDILV